MTHGDDDLLEVVLARRPDRVAEAALHLLPEDARQKVVAAQEDVAALALALPAATPSDTVRSRLLDTVRRLPKVRRALVVVDMINDHLTPGRILEVPRARDIVPALVARIAEARREGTPVVYVLDRHDPSDTDLEDWGEHAVEGTEGANVWLPLAPKPGDPIVTKPSYSSFFRSRLTEVLDGLKVDTIELTGCSTEVQLLSTATDALQLGFAVEVSALAASGNERGGRASCAPHDAVPRPLQARAPGTPRRASLRSGVWRLHGLEPERHDDIGAVSSGWRLQRHRLEAGDDAFLDVRREPGRAQLRDVRDRAVGSHLHLQSDLARHPGIAREPGVVAAAERGAKHRDGALR